MPERKYAIGGYMSLDAGGELPVPSSGAVAVNSGRNALLLILRSLPEVSKVYLPDYYCPEVETALRDAGYETASFHINRNLEGELPENIDEKSVAVLCDYFGIKRKYIKRVSRRYGRRIIIDNCQSWKGTCDCGGGAFWSPRKFFGVADGGFALVRSGIEESLEKVYEGLPEGHSAQLYSAIMIRTDKDAESGYEEFREVEKEIGKLAPARMSGLTRAVLSNFDVVRMMRLRKRNGEILNRHLGKYNELEFPEGAVAMAYPLMLSDKSAIRELRIMLRGERIYCARYWENCPNDTGEFILPLPLDQRCTEEDMENIAGRVEKYLKSLFNNKCCRQGRMA